MQEINGVTNFCDRLGRWNMGIEGCVSMDMGTTDSRWCRNRWTWDRQTRDDQSILGHWNRRGGVCRNQPDSISMDSGWLEHPWAPEHWNVGYEELALLEHWCMNDAGTSWGRWGRMPAQTPAALTHVDTFLGPQYNPFLECPYRWVIHMMRYVVTYQTSCWMFQPKSPARWYTTIYLYKL